MYTYSVGPVADQCMGSHCLTYAHLDRKLNAHLDRKLNAHLDRKLNAHLDRKLNAHLDRKLNAHLDRHTWIGSSMHTWIGNSMHTWIGNSMHTWTGTLGYETPLFRVHHRKYMHKPITYIVYGCYVLLCDTTQINPKCLWL